MKVQQAALNLALKMAGRVIDAKATNSTYALVRLTQGQANLELVAVSHNGGMRLTMAAALDDQDRETPVDLLVGARSLGDIVALAPDGGEITLKRTKITATAPKLTVTWPGSTANFTTVDAKIGGTTHVKPAIEGVKVPLDADTLRTVLPMVAFAVAGPNDTNRPLLQGINLRLNGQGQVAGSNGFHLMAVNFDTPANTPPVNVTLPARFCAALTFLLSTVEVEQPATLTIGENVVAVEYGGVLVWSSLITGAYPDLSGIFPKAFAAQATVTQAEFLRLARTAKTINAAQAALQLRPNLVALYAEEAYSGTAHPVGVAQGSNSLTVFINPAYLIDAIRVMPRGDLKVAGNAANTPVIISPDASTRYVLMPLNAGDRTAPEPEVDLFTLAAPRAAEDAIEKEVTDDEFFALAQASSSVERIIKGMIKKPFAYKGRLYVGAGGTGSAVHCYRVVPEAEYQGTKTTYDAASKARPKGGSLSYTGIVVQQGSKKFVITDEELNVKRATEPEPEVEAPVPGQAALGVAA